MRYYVEYSADCGFGALMVSHDVIEASGKRDALQNWSERVKGAPAFAEQGPDACFRVPRRMELWDREAILNHYKDADFGRTRSAAFVMCSLFGTLPHWRLVCRTTAPGALSLGFALKAAMARTPLVGLLSKALWGIEIAARRWRWRLARSGT